MLLFSRFSTRVYHMLEGFKWAVTNRLLVIHLQIVFKQLLCHGLNQEQGGLPWLISSTEFGTVTMTARHSSWRQCLVWVPLKNEDTIYKLWARMILFTTFLAHILQWRYTFFFSFLSMQFLNWIWFLGRHLIRGWP